MKLRAAVDEMSAVNVRACGMHSDLKIDAPAGETQERRSNESGHVVAPSIEM